jgi:hypothetical protein
MSGANYEFCPVCDTKALYVGEDDTSHVMVLHLKCWGSVAAALVNRAGWVVDSAGRYTCPPAESRPPIVVLCGSTRFGDAYRAANLRETLAGKIVLSIGCDTRSDADLAAAGELGQDMEATKAMLDELHLRKIDRADEVLVLNVSGYIGESTRREIDYAIEHGKPVRYLEAVSDS